MKIPVAVLCSGGGTNFQAIINAAEAGMLPHAEIKLVVSDHRDAHVLERAARHGVETKVFDVKEIPDRMEREGEILNFLKNRGIEFVVFAGFMTILSERFIHAYENRIINVHPALLPSFGGKGMYGLHVHEAALKRGVKVTGATVHYVTEECDGGPILLQRAVEVRPGDTPESLQKRVMREAEWIILPEALEMECKKLTKE